MGLTVYHAGYPAVERQSKCALSHEVLGLVQNHQQRTLIYKLRRGFNHVHAHVHAHVHSSRSLLRPCANMQSSELPYAMRLAVVKSPSSLEDGGMQGVWNEKPTSHFLRLFFCLTFMSGPYLLLSPPSSFESQILPGDTGLSFCSVSS